MDLILRRATPDDAEAIAEVYVASWNEGFGPLLPPRVLNDEQVARWRRELDAAQLRWWVAQSVGAVVGFAGTGPSRDPVEAGLGELDTIAVAPTAWRLGVGRRLMSAAHDDLVAAGFREGIVWTLAEYAIGRDFYEAMGWHASGELRDSGREMAFRRSLATSSSLMGPDPHFAEPRLARLYDALDADRSDLDHYVALVDELGGRRVLDLGCGTGVLALMLADRGIDVLAVDPAAASLDVARGRPGAERVTWVEANATQAPIGHDVDVVVATGNVAQVFLDDDEWGAVLRRAAAMLGTGGHVVFETREPSRRAWESWTQELTSQRITDDVEGTVESWQQVIEVDLPLVTFEHHFRFADGSRALSTSTLRFRTRAEIEKSLADAWLDLVEVRDAPDRPGDELVFIVRKPVDPRDDQDRGWRDLARIEADLELGRITEEQWHERVLDLIEPIYLNAGTPHGQSGKGGDAAGWEYARRLICDAIDRNGTFLDIGCANGLLMEDIQRWAADDGHRIEPHGVDISAKLADLARHRYPQWADRIHTANAHGWIPPQRYDVVRTGLDYVPATSRPSYLQHLLAHVVAPGGRLIIGAHNLKEDEGLTDYLTSWGHQVAGISRRPHARPGLAYSIHWIDAPLTPDGGR